MKQYLLAGVAVLLVSAHASDNPFDLKENFGKLDQDQAMLLGDLKKIAEAQELAKEQALEDDVEVVEKKVEVIPIVENNVNKETTIISDARLDAMRQKALEASKQEALKKGVKEELPKEVVEGKEAREKAALIVAAKQKEVELKKAKENQQEARKEAERREVEAYEKQRAEKLAKEKAAAQAAALEREALAQQEAKAKQKAAATAKVQKQANPPKLAKEKAPAKKVEVVQVSKVENTTKTIVNDINVTREKLEAKMTADKAYEEAVKEMSQED